MLPEWVWPANPFLALVIIVSLLGGGRFVERSFARRGGHAFVPASFSFGWLGYVFTALFRLIYHGTLMPKPAFPLRLINLENATSNENHSWLISQYFKECVDGTTRQLGKQTRGIRIKVFEAAEKKSSAVYNIYIDELFSSALILAQFGVGFILGCMRNDWGVFNITLHGTMISFWIGCLPQWNAEKNPTLRQPDHAYALTMGKDHHELVIIKCHQEGVNLDRLSRWRSTTSRESRFFHMVPFLMSLSLLYSILLIETNQAVLCIVGILGMADNFISCWWTRQPYEWDMCLSMVDIICSPNIMDGLMDYETTHGHGISLKREYFPGKLDQATEDWWNGETAEYDAIRNQESETRTRPRSD